MPSTNPYKPSVSGNTDASSETALYFLYLSLVSCPCFSIIFPIFEGVNEEYKISSSVQSLCTVPKHNSLASPVPRWPRSTLSSLTSSQNILDHRKRGNWTSNSAEHDCNITESLAYLDLFCYNTAVSHSSIILDIHCVLWTD